MTLTGLHSQLGEVKFRVRELGNDPDSQVRQTLGLMQERTAEDVGNPEFVAWVRGAFDVPMYAQSGGEVPWVERVWEHAKQGIQFQRDEQTGGGLGLGGRVTEDVIETIIRPLDMARYVSRGVAVGDCDDFSMYVAACLGVLGIPCEFVTVAADARVPEQFSHVYVVAYPRDDRGERVRLAVDASHGEYCGWEVPNQYGKMATWRVVDRLSWWVGNAVMQTLVVAGVWLGARHFFREARA